MVLHLLVSQSSMVRSVKVTLSSASMRIIVLVLNVQGHKGIQADKYNIEIINKKCFKNI